jgi:hypothetical protein
MVLIRIDLPHDDLSLRDPSSSIEPVAPCFGWRRAGYTASMSRYAGRACGIRDRGASRMAFTASRLPALVDRASLTLPNFISPKN